MQTLPVSVVLVYHSDDKRHLRRMDQVTASICLLTMYTWSSISQA